MPPCARHEDHPDRHARAHDHRVVVGAAGHAPARQVQLARSVRGRLDHGGVARDRHVLDDRRDLQLEPAPGGDLARRRDRRLDDLLARREVGVAHVDVELDLAGDDVDRARTDAQHADRPDGRPARRPARDPLELRHRLGGTGERVAPQPHRRRAGVRGRAAQRQPEVVRRSDRRRRRRSTRRRPRARRPARCAARRAHEPLPDRSPPRRARPDRSPRRAARPPCSSRRGRTAGRGPRGRAVRRPPGCRRSRCRSAAPPRPTRRGRSSAAARRLPRAADGRPRSRRARRARRRSDRRSASCRRASRSAAAARPAPCPASGRTGCRLRRAARRAPPRASIRRRARAPRRRSACRPRA